MFRYTLLSIITLCALSVSAQNSTLLKAQKLKKWNFPAGNYSGISPLGNNRYAIVTDKPKTNGFYEWEITMNAEGKITHAHNLGFRTDSIHTTPRDMEGIVFVPSSNTVFISAENDQQILEYTLTGQLTGRKLSIPGEMSLLNIQDNYGFEALAYSQATGLFWTTSENTLKSDLKDISILYCGNTGCAPAFLRLQSFTSDLEPSLQFAYKTDTPLKQSASHKLYCFGVPEITALSDGSLIILEREFYVAPHIAGSFVENKLYRVHPTEEKSITFADSFKDISADKFLKKTLITKFRTTIPKIANYEGMCLGPELPDGTHSLILISDSQDNYGNLLYHLRDRIRVILFK